MWLTGYAIHSNRWSGSVVMYQWRNIVLTSLRARGVFVIKPIITHGGTSCQIYQAVMASV